MLMLPKTFPRQSLDAITTYRGFNVFTCDGQTKPRRRELVILPQYHKIFITGPFRCAGEHALEFTALGKALSAGETPAA